MKQNIKFGWFAPTLCLPTWNSLIKDKVNFLKRSALELWVEKESPDTSDSAQSPIDEAHLGAQVTVARIHEVRDGK